MHSLCLRECFEPDIDRNLNLIWFFGPPFITTTWYEFNYQQEYFPLYGWISMFWSKSCHENWNYWINVWKDQILSTGAGKVKWFRSWLCFHPITTTTRVPITTSQKKGTSLQPRKLILGMQPYLNPTSWNINYLNYQQILFFVGFSRIYRPFYTGKYHIYADITWLFIKNITSY